MTSSYEPPSIAPIVFSDYFARQTQQGKHDIAHIQSLAQQLPLSIDQINQLIANNTVAHSDVEYAAGVALRLTRTQVMLALIEYDLNHSPDLTSLNHVTQTISHLADASVTHAMRVARAALREINGEALTQSGQPMPLWILGMGKLAGHELNVSSDVDLIMVYEHEGETDISQSGRKSLSHSEFFEKLGRRVIKLLDEVTEHGFVFRVDMRLRPNGSSGPLCVSLSMLEKYFLSQARTWERFAWLKSRIINPDTHSLVLQQLITPFVFRRYLDYDAIDALRDVHQKIRVKADSRTQNHVVDVKVGAGGIREIEFIVQLHQIIKGARQQHLQQPNTLQVLPQLAQLHLITDEQCEHLLEHYVFLRHLEHRIQYRNDAQTQILPEEHIIQDQIAQSLGLPSHEQLIQKLNTAMTEVAQQFGELFEPVSVSADRTYTDPQNDDDSELLSAFDSPQTLQEFITRLDTDSRITQLPEKNQIRYKLLVKRTLTILQQQYPSPIPINYATRVFNFFDAVAKRSSYLALLVEYPKALEYLISLFVRSKWAGDYLTAHPILLDELLLPTLLSMPPDWVKVEADLQRDLAQAYINEQTPDVERQMDILRETHHAQIFRLLAQELNGMWSVEALADHLSALTDLILRQALHFCWQAFPKRHQEHPQFAIIAYGKLGGKEMGYASDLDLVFLYQDDHPEAIDLYTRFGQRLNNWLTAPTAAGVLFETDYRLRPNGASGLLVSSTQMFKQYQTQSAWFWEHQAITRARYCVGDASIGSWFESERRDILMMPRERSYVNEEIRSMRAKIQAGHPNPTDLFDVKYDAGGMVDVEFCVQALVLLYSKDYPELIENKGNIALLMRAADAGLIDHDLAQTSGAAYRTYRSIQHASRLQNISHTRVDPVTVQPHIDAINRLFSTVFT